MRYCLARCSTLMIGFVAALDDVGTTLVHAAEKIGRAGEESEGYRARKQEGGPIYTVIEQRRSISFYDTRKRIQPEQPAPPGGDQARWIYDRRSEHPELYQEWERKTNVAVHHIERRQEHPHA